MRGTYFVNIAVPIFIRVIYYVLYMYTSQRPAQENTSHQISPELTDHIIPRIIQIYIYNIYYICLYV